MGHWSLGRIIFYTCSKSTKYPHVSGEAASRPQREDAVADGLLMDASEELSEAKEATDGDLLMGGVELVLDDRCRWLLADSDCKSLHLALDDKLFIIIPGRVGEGVGLEVLEKKLARCRC
jgi:hypothetical protein